MSKKMVILLSMGLACGILYGQGTYTLNGKVVDEHSNPLFGATVFVYPVAKGAVTDNSGNYYIHALSKGNYKVTISYVGYKSLVDTVFIDRNTIRNVQLRVANLRLQEVVVTDDYATTRQQEEPLNIEIVNDTYLKQQIGGSLMKSLERLPGVSTIDIGSGQSKPVIRGMGFNRVLVVENSIKHEGQQWGEDHGLEIDQYAVDNVEVVKGPGSLLYGSDAIGGVIDLKNKRIPEDNTIGGSIDLTGKTNNDFLGTSVYLYSRKKWFFADLHATIVDYGDYKVPTDSVNIYSYRAALYKNHLRNTAGEERNLNLSFGLLFGKFQSRFFIGSVGNRSGFFANAHGLEPRNVDAALHDKSSRDLNYPFQEVNHLKVINKSQYVWTNLKMETDLGFQRNYRQEWSQYVSHGYMPAVFQDTLGFESDLEREFEKYVYSANLRLTYTYKAKSQLVVGANSDFQDNRINGRSFIIPAFKQLIMGGFALVKLAFSENSQLQLGVRYDYGNIHTKPYSDWFISPLTQLGDTTYAYAQRAAEINRSFSNFSWSIGYNYNLKSWSLKANIGKSFRMPIAKELAANGVNYHHFSYEIGNAAVAPEVSYQLDAGLEYNSTKLALGATPFLNYFTNYIYLNPTSDYDRLYGNGNQIYTYTQSEVFRFGGEIHMHYQFRKYLQLGVMGEYVFSEQLSGNKKGFGLPFSPPASAVLNVKYQKPRLAFAENTYFSIDYKLTAAQNTIVPPEETTPGYQVVNVGLGGEVYCFKQKLNINLQVQNVLNTKYFNHTNYYRLLNVPEAGRNVVVNITIPFSNKLNKVSELVK